MYLYARFLGFTGSIVQCDEWSKKEFKKRNFNALLENEIDSMQQDIAKLRDAIDMGIVKQDMGTSRIAMLQKELRGSIKQLNDEKVLLDKQGLILAGADRALREMISIFRDDPIEGPLQEASMGVWTKILSEES
jgi:Tfp pilus assembly protein PilN